MSNLISKIEEMEKEVVYLTGRKRAVARNKYRRLLITCRKECGLDEPIYLKRS